MPSMTPKQQKQLEELFDVAKKELLKACNGDEKMATQLAEIAIGKNTFAPVDAIVRMRKNDFTSDSAFELALVSLAKLQFFCNTLSNAPTNSTKLRLRDIALEIVGETDLNKYTQRKENDGTLAMYSRVAVRKLFGLPEMSIDASALVKAPDVKIQQGKEGGLTKEDFQERQAVIKEFTKQATSVKPEQIQKNLIGFIVGGDDKKFDKEYQTHKNRIKVNEKNSDGQTLLHIAASIQPASLAIINIINLLVNEGVNINAQDNGNMTPLQIAVYQGNAALVKAFIANKNSWETVDQNNLKSLRTVLELGKKSGVFKDGNFDAVAKLLDEAKVPTVSNVNVLIKYVGYKTEKKKWATVDVNAPQNLSSNVESPQQDFGISNDNTIPPPPPPPPPSLSGGNINVGKQEIDQPQPPLILSKSDPETVKKQLFEALAARNLQTFSDLLKTPGAKLVLDDIGSRSMTLLHEASLRNVPTEYSKLLLNAGANPNKAEGNGYTPVDYAVADGRADIVENYRNAKNNKNAIPVTDETWKSAKRMFANSGQNLGSDANYNLAHELVNKEITRIFPKNE